MDIEEQQLRDALGDPSWELPTWPEGAQRIRRVARRRRQRNLTALLGVAVLVVAVSGVTTWQLRSPSTGTKVSTGALRAGQHANRQQRSSGPPTFRDGSNPNRSSSSTATTTPASTATTAPASTSTTVQKPTGPVSNVASGFEPASVTFVSPTTGWVLGTIRGCSALPCTAMAKTTNSGRSWTQVAAPDDALPATSGAPGAGISRVRFANPEDGWAFKPDLWATHDGGRTWNMTTLPGNESVIDLEANPQSVWVLAATYSTTTGYGSPQLFESSATSNNFQVVSGATFPTGPDVSLAVSGNTAWLAGPGQLVATTAGSSLSARTDPCPATDVPQLGAFSNGVLAVACGGNGAAGSSTKQVYLSLNGGRSYATVSAAPSGGQLNGVATNGSTVVVAAASGASVLYADSGHGWQTVYSAPGGASLADLGFTTTTQGVAILGNVGQTAATQMLMSRDGGLKWSPVHF